MEEGQLVLLAGPGRPSWCYGTPGIARALQLAGIALGDPARCRGAEDALLRSVIDPVQLDSHVDTSVCHGWASTVATVWHAAQDLNSSGLSNALGPLTETLCARADESLGGPIGLVDGVAGVALTLHTIATGEAKGWGRCLLLS